MTTTNETTNALVLLDTLFDSGEGEAAIKPVLSEHPRLQWFNGLLTTNRETVIGWHIEADVNPKCDEAALDAGLRRYVVQHKSTGTDGGPKELPYWALNLDDENPPALFIVTYGLQSKQQMNKSADRLGIAYGWEILRDKQGNIVYKPNSNEPKKQCRIQFRAFVQSLCAHGFEEWLAGSINGHLTDSLLDTLNQQFRVLSVYNTQRQRKTTPFFAFALPMVPGAVKMVGPKGGDQSAIYSIKAKIPATIDEAYFAKYLITPTLLAKIRDGLGEETMLWSVERSLAINGEKEEEQPDVFESSEEENVVEGTAVSDAPDRVITLQEWQWIAFGYCGGDATYQQQLCTRFGVSDLKQLCYSHYETLQAEVAQFQQNKQ